MQILPHWHPWEEKYDDGYACALVASCGALGPIIPPSIMMVLYSGVTNIPINKLFLAGYIPGLLIAAGYMLVNYMYAKRNNINKTKFAGFKVLGQNTIYAAPALVMPCIIIFGIMLGVVTATEAGVLYLQHYLWDHKKDAECEGVERLPDGCRTCNGQLHDHCCICRNFWNISDKL